MSYRRVNLYYLYTASSVSIKDFRIYEKLLSDRLKITSLGDREKGSLYYLVDTLLNNNCEIELLDNFYYSYTIPHIGKEFDLLKIDNKKILNIELKSENVGLDRIKTQLVRNYNYLKYLSLDMYLFTFVSDSKTFYKLNDNFELVTTSVEEVLKAIYSFKGNIYPDIDKLFKTSDYLVSPNVHPHKFINEQYFLTSQQEFIKNKIFQVLKNENIIKITGEAGTGKTLLLFDIAKDLSKNNKVLIINCNKYNEAHELINKSLVNVCILCQQELMNNKNIINDYDYILLDEAQRMDNGLWRILNENLDKKIIFTLDPKQVLTKEEIKANYNSLIDGLGAIKYKLSNRIRINNNIKEFTYFLFDMNRNKSPLDLTNVNVHYASNTKELLTYFNLYKNDYTYISIPNTNYIYGDIEMVDINEVVGKDYENVLMVLDNNFFYSDRKLSSYNSKKNDYLYLKILYQGLSRTRENVSIIIYRNRKLFKELLENLK